MISTALRKFRLGRKSFTSYVRIVVPTHNSKGVVAPLPGRQRDPENCFQVMHAESLALDDSLIGTICQRLECPRQNVCGLSEVQGCLRILFCMGSVLSNFDGIKQQQYSTRNEPVAGNLLWVLADKIHNLLLQHAEIQWSAHLEGGIFGSAEH